MDTRSIVVIKTILEEGSFQKAAQRLNCSQSTVTFQVRQLENELSVRLFERLGRRMVFTPAGKSILPHMEAILHSMQAITACNDPASLHGELRVAVAESLLSYKLHTLLGDFVERAPAVKLQLHSLNCHDIREGILSGQYDLGSIMMWAVIRTRWRCCRLARQRGSSSPRPCSLPGSGTSIRPTRGRRPASSSMSLAASTGNEWKPTFEPGTSCSATP